ncbi:MAG: hypothetical protein M1830_006713 [Pleopsidium flavum]|nr:MAG: hypothetical protein M1830_006713 [Pleopsidium flavum]
MENGSVVSNGDGDGLHNQDDEEAMRFPKEKSSLSGSGGHKRSLSGSILSKLSFLRTTQDDSELLPQLRQTDGTSEVGALKRNYSGAMAVAVQQQKKTRKRKGSLRKTALLGTGRLRLEGRERRGSTLEQVKSLHDTLEREVYGHGDGDLRNLPGASPPDDLANPQSTFDAPSLLQSRNPYLNGHIHSVGKPRSPENNAHVSPATSPTLGDASTTDEDEMITFPRLFSAANTVPSLKKPISSGSESYFPPQSSPVQRRRSSNKLKSPLAALASEAAAPSEEGDYSDTEWWGWVVLVVTWVVFVVGMGSCFGVWSWAWDVGETPYAPPELEDDPTLPIVGYYPALIILTAVMAWVWVVVAWVGMKYFKHAKISGEDI